jgi:uncharacterized protein YjiS (DUF1127 family)
MSATPGSLPQKPRAAFRIMRWLEAIAWQRRRRRKIDQLDLLALTPHLRADLGLTTMSDQLDRKL